MSSEKPVSLYDKITRSHITNVLFTQSQIKLQFNDITHAILKDNLDNLRIFLLNNRKRSPKAVANLDVLNLVADQLIKALNR